MLSEPRQSYLHDSSRSTALEHQRSPAYVLLLIAARKALG